MPTPDMSELFHKNFARDGPLVAIAFTSIFIGYYMIRSRSNIKGRPISDLPGPERAYLPLLGNVKNFPRKAWSDTFKQWGETMGDVIYMRLPHRRFIVLNSLEDAEELLVKRANIWSGRPYHQVVNDLMGFGWALIQTLPGHNFTEQRKIFRGVLGPQVVKDYDHLIEREAESFINRLRGFSGDPTEIVFGSVGAVIIELSYGPKVLKEHGAVLAKLNIDGMALMTWSFQQAWLPNFFPITRYLPSWIPGIQFHKYVARGQHLFGNIRNLAFNVVQKNIDEGTADFSVLSRYMDAPGVSNAYLQDATAVLYMAGADTTGSAILNFIAHMLLYPSIQTKVYQEIRDKIGPGGTITSSGVKSLEYLGATWKESMRFNSTVPTGIPHCNTADDVWKGYYIPKGTVIIPNIAFMMRDPRIWGDDANAFKPERFLAQYNPRVNELPDVESVPFGFGRRICPGRYIAERNGVLFVARLLQAYEILPDKGAPTPLEITFGDSLVRRPTDLRCRFVSR